MSEAPKRIWGVFDQYGHGSTMLREIQQCRNPMYGGPEPTAYIRADLVEAAIKRALEDKLEKLIIGAETVLEEWDRGDEAAFREAIEEMRADVEEAKEGMT